MRNKKIFALTVILTMIISAFSTFASSADATEQTSVSALTGFGLCEGKNAEDTVTRADMAKMIADIYFDNYVIENSSTTFSDVSKSHWASGYINLLWEKGVIHGDGGRFYPDYDIKVVDLVCMLLNMAGHAEIAEYDGGYSAGYINLSNKYKLLSGVDKGYNDTITYAELERIFLNYLDVPYMSVQLKSNGYDIYSDPDETVFTEVYKGEEVQGQIIGNKKTLLVSTREEEKPVITINDVDYIDKNLLYQDYIGYNVTAYVSENDEGDYEVLYVDPKPSNTVTSYLLDEFYIEDSDKLYYYKENRAKRIKIDERADFIYNGVTYINWSLGLFESEMGSVDLLDNDSDGDIDLITMHAYENYFVDYVNSFNGEIVDKNGKEKLILDDDNEEIIYSITHMDTSIGVGDIKENQILTVVKSKNTQGMRYIDIQVSENTVSGRIMSRDSEWIRINNQTYRYDKGLADQLTDITDGKFYLDIYGNIVAVENTMTDGVNSDNSGIFIAHYYDDDEEISYVRIITTTGKIKKFQTTEKVKHINGAKTERLKSHELFAKEQFVNTAGYVIQLVNYRLNTEGLLDTIITAVDTTGGVVGGAGRDYNNFSLDIRMTAHYRRPNNMGNAVYGASNIMPYNFYVSSNTKVISLPRTVMQGYVEEDEILISSSLAEKTDVGNKDGKANCEDGLVYDCSETNIASVVITFYDSDRTASSSRWNSDTDMFIVSDKSMVLGDDGDTCYKLTGSRGTKIDRVVTATGPYGNSDCEIIEPGDVVQWYADFNNGKLFWARRIFTLTDDNDTTTLHLSDRKRMLINSLLDTFFIGEVVASDSVSLMVDMNSSDGYQTYFPQSYTNIVVMDITGANINLSFGNLKDIAPGMTVVGNTRSHILRDLIVIKED